MTWFSRDGEEVPGPAGDLDAVGPEVLAEHATAVAAMSDDDLLAIFARCADVAPDAQRATLAAGLRAYTARSPEAAAVLFMTGKRWTFAVKPTDAA